MTSTQEYLIDELATPRSRRGFLRQSSCLLRVRGGKIEDISSISRLSSSRRSRKVKRLRTVIPGLIDAHTHTLFAGDRAEEWNQRLQGVSYQEIARRGGGIKRTVTETRHASLRELLQLGQGRLRAMLAFGVTTVEMKSGYGLEMETELKLLDCVERLRKLSPQTLLSTFMGAHAVPSSFESEEAYVSYLISEVLPKVKGKADFQDIFCERGYFSEAQSIRLLNAGKKYGLKPRIHAHEFARSGGVRVAAQVRALSADHLMVMNVEDMRLLKRAHVVPVVLPGTSFFLGAKAFAPALKMWDAGLPVAIASDFNPGTNPTLNLPLCGTFAAIHQGLSLEQVLTAQTYHAAKALGLKDRGCLEPGMRADFVELDAPHFETLYYSYGTSSVSSVWISGHEVRV